MKEKKLYNVSLTYFLPIVFKWINNKTISKSIRFIKDTYLIDEKNNDNFVIVLHRYNLHNKEINPSIIEEYIKAGVLDNFLIKNDEIILYIKLDNYLKEERQKIINGEYSQILVENKHEIVKFVFINSEDENHETYKTVSGILYQTPKYKKELLLKFGLNLEDVKEDIELREKIDLNEETYRGR